MKSCIFKLAVFLCIMPFVAGLSVQYKIKLWKLLCTQLLKRCKNLTGYIRYIWICQCTTIIYYSNNCAVLYKYIWLFDAITGCFSRYMYLLLICVLFYSHNHLTYNFSMMPCGTENTNGQSSRIIQDFLNILYFGRRYTGPPLYRVSNMANPFMVKAPYF